MQTEIDPRDLIGHKAVDRNGDKIGTVDEVYLDDATGSPEWAAVRTGLFGRDAFVPLATSEFVSDELRIPYDKSQVKDSPDFGVGQHLSPEQELQLYRYYGLEVPGGNHNSGSGSGSGSGGGKDSTAPAPAAATPTAPASPIVPAAAVAAP
ncbi:PRC-barrel domain-containing protein, partial [Streptacidiphilus carbonis]|uniref:PRC-barrel domain-containing protein n=1 Tax=Streptacidiphilus carbonis TaxID=105422 RepID=UPI0009FC4FE7